jgi:hypothetical protein
MPRLPRLNESLGWYAIAWIQHFLVHGPGDVQGQRIELDDELAAFALKAYELDPRGNRKVRRAFLSRAKGRNKSGFAAMIECFEALGECRFDHWAEPGEVSDWGYRFEPGEPVGKPLTYVEALNVATEESQAGNTYDAVYYMLHPETCSENLFDRFGAIDVGLTRTNLPGSRGSIEPVSASNESKDGGKSTFIVADEALAVDTPIPTPTGWSTMGELQPGDMVIGSDGLPVIVVKATDVQHDRQCYRVTFEDGTSVVASDGHLWLTKVTPSAALPRVRTTGEMVADGRKFRVPVGKSWKLPSVELPVDPYLLGYWLGDGSTGQPNLTVGDQDLTAVEELLAARGIVTHRLSRTVNRPQRISFSRMTGFHVGTPLGDAFRALPCWKDKHIPTVFLRASIEQRIDLLQGLMDSDGHIDPSGHCTFVGTEKLATGVVDMLRGLGQVARLNWVSDPRSRYGGYCKVHFTPRGGLVPFALPRKAALVRDHRRGPDWVTVKSIEPVDTTPVRCIAVASADHLFAAGAGGHMTHNTHLWLPPAAGVFKLGKMHQTMVRNLLKRKLASGWMLETSTMYAKGENSVAEGTHKYANDLAGRKDSPLLFDHRQASDHWNLDDRAERIEALKEAYGPAAAWMNLEAIADYWDDPQASEAEFKRFWLNQPVKLEVERTVFDLAGWMRLEDRECEAPRRVALVVHVADFQESSTIAVAGDIAGGATYVMVLTGEGIGWVADKVDELVSARDIAEVGLAPGEARGLEGELSRRGIEFKPLSGTDIAASCTAFQSAVKQAVSAVGRGEAPGLRHAGQPELDGALASGKTRRRGVSETWNDGTGSALIGAAAAYHRWTLQEAPLPAIY